MIKVCRTEGCQREMLYVRVQDDRFIYWCGHCDLITQDELDNRIYGSDASDLYQQAVEAKEAKEKGG